MRLSAPVYQLKRQARLLSREDKIPLHMALDRVAAREGLGNWSLLASRVSRARPSGRIHSMLDPGDLVLVAARPGHGKTLLGLELAVEAMRAGHRAAFFSLEYMEADMVERFRAIDVDPRRFESAFSFDNSDGINAEHVVAAFADAKPGAMAVIDYLQLLDQRRDNPALAEQVRMLKAFAQGSGVIVVAISQVDRRYDPAQKPFPDLADIRLPNPVDLDLFSKACFLNDGEVRFQTIA